MVYTIVYYLIMAKAETKFTLSFINAITFTIVPLEIILFAYTYEIQACKRF